MVARKLSFLLLCASASLSLSAGCASSRSGPFLGQKFDDPPQLSPYNQPLNAQARPAVPDQQITGYRGPAFFGPWTGTQQGRFYNGGMLGGLPPATQTAPTPLIPSPSPQRGPIELGQPQPTESAPIDDLGTDLGTPRTYREDGVPTYSDPQAAPEADGETIRRRQDGALNAPLPGESSLTPQADDPATQPLELEVNDPQQVLLAETADFKVIIRNPFSEPVEEVVIVVRFDEGLSFPGLPDRALRQRLGTLGASESRTLDLSLTAANVGQQCVDFALSAAGRAQIDYERCVQVVDPQTSVVPQQQPGGVTVELVGPPERNVGGRLECLLTIHNQTGQEVSGIVATLHHDMALVPREASTGAKRSPGTLAWDLGLLRIDERVQMTVEFACPTPTEQACVAAEVIGRDVPSQRQEVCVLVRPRPTLDVAVTDVRDPVPVGETTTYRLTLTNRGLEPISGIRVDVTADGGLVMLPGDLSVSQVTVGAGDPGPPQTATYTISETIGPDEVRQVLIDVRGTEVGTAGVRIVATELRSGRRFQVEEPTMINPPLLELPTFEDIAAGRR
jgi:hypothetical protein